MAINWKRVRIGAGVLLLVVVALSVIEYIISREGMLEWEGWLEESSLTSLTRKYWALNAREYIDAEVEVLRGKTGVLHVMAVPESDLERALSRWPKEIEDLCPPPGGEILTLVQLTCYARVPKRGTYYVIVTNGWLPDFQSNDVYIKLTIRYK